MKRAVIFATVIVVIAVSQPVHAFDGQRRGFVLGFQAGFGWARMTGPAEDYFQPGSAVGLGTAAKIGAGLNEQWILYSADRSILFREAGGHNITQGLTSIGAMYFLQPSGPSAFITAEFGSVFRTEYTDHVSWFSGSEGQTGAGFGIGGGYEFGNHVVVEGHLSGGDVGGSYGANHGLANIILTVGWFGY